MTGPQPTPPRALADQVLLSGSGQVLAGEPAEVRRQALRLIHEYAVANDSSVLVWLGPELAVEESLTTPWSRDDLVWALRLLLDSEPERAISDAPFWVPALIAAALGPAEL